MSMNDRPRLGRALAGSILALAWLAGLSCSNSADNGGMSGTGISQGAISSFGSIFVNGVEWQTDGAQVEIDGVMRPATDLRVGMVVRVQGDLAASGSSGTALDVVYDTLVAGPIEQDAMLANAAGTEKTFVVLGRTVLVDEITTAFDGGASFASLRRDDVVGISGFVDDSGVVHASRVESKGQFPTVDEAELEGVVENLSQSPDGSGIFDIGTITIEYDAMTVFSGVSSSALAAGDYVDVSGRLVGGGTDRIAADRIDLEDEGLGIEDREDAEVEGFVTNFVSVADFRVSGIPVDASGATLEPSGSMIQDGSFVEIEGSLLSGVLVATRVGFESEQFEDVKIRAAISAINPTSRIVTILGVQVLFDGKTELEDERDDDEHFGFADLRVGDWLRIEGVATGIGTARAKQAKRDAPGSDVVLEGPVTSLDRMLPSLSVLGQPVPIHPIDAMDVMTTSYFNQLGNPRSEKQFFSNPGDVQLSDIVRVTDVGALQSDALLEADIVRIDD